MAASAGAARVAVMVSEDSVVLAMAYHSSTCVWPLEVAMLARFVKVSLPRESVTEMTVWVTCGLLPLQPPPQYPDWLMKTMMTSGDLEVEKEPLVTLDAPVTSVPLALPSSANPLPLAVVVEEVFVVVVVAPVVEVVVVGVVVVETLVVDPAVEVAVEVVAA
jgi:hypothetical protein